MHFFLASALAWGRAAMHLRCLLSIAILLQLKCVNFYCPVNRAQARQHLWVLFWAERGRHKQNICLQIEFLCLLSLTRVFDNQGGLGLGQVSVAIMFNPPLRFLTSHMNSQAMCLPFVSTARS